MRLRFPEPVGDRPHEVDQLEVSGMVLRVLAVEPLPEDRVAWRRRIAGHEVVHANAHTPTGWPLTIVLGDRSVLGFYELFDRGVVVSLTATSGELELSRARPLLEAADLDRRPREIVALSQLWQDGSGET